MAQSPSLCQVRFSGLEAEGLRLACDYRMFPTVPAANDEGSLAQSNGIGKNLRGAPSRPEAAPRGRGDQKMRQGKFIATMISPAHLPEACRSKVLYRLSARSPRETPKSETRLATTRRASGYALQIHHKHPQFSYPLRIFLDSEPWPKNRLVCPFSQLHCLPGLHCSICRAFSGRHLPEPLTTEY